MLFLSAGGRAEGMSSHFVSSCQAEREGEVSPARPPQRMHGK